MGDILKSWLQQRLGVIMDLTPEIFGHYTKDGRLMAQILYNYDIITRGQLDTIIQSHDPALCRVNLKHLRVWLRFLAIDFDDENLIAISCGKGAAALQLFYKIYLCLESKDRLHFVTLQKEREKFVPKFKKFHVTFVDESPPAYESSDHSLMKTICNSQDTIEWYKIKFQSALLSIKRKHDKIKTEKSKYKVNLLNN